MPTYLDAHDLGNVTEEQLKQTQNAPINEFGVIHDNILYNKEENKAFCILDAPNKEAVEKTHQKLGIKCDWITEVKITAGFVQHVHQYLMRMTTL
ncbi:MAG TPA: nickel-binding protein [Nitrososphaera sp.]|jgi:hypothetical protein